MTMKEYVGHLYECIGKREDEKWILSDVNDGYAIYVSDKALLNSTEFYYTEKY